MDDAAVPARRRALPRGLRTALRRAGAALVLAALHAGAPAAAQTLVVEAAQGAFDDARVQSALSLAANWPALAARSGVRVGAVVLRSGGRDRALTDTPADPQRARQLLAEAGHPADRPLPLLILHESALEKLALAAARVLRGIGLDAKLQPVTPQTRAAAIAATRFVTGRQTVELAYLVLAQEQQAAPPPRPLADLAIPGRPEVDHDPRRRRLTVAVTVANLGAAPAGAHRLAVIDRSGTLAFAPVRIDGLGARSTGAFKATAEVPDAALGRTLVLHAEIDAGGEVSEADEGNNRSPQVRFAVPAPEPERVPDLVVLGAPEVEHDAARRRVAVRVTLANVGTAPAGAHRLDVTDRSGALRFPPVPVAGLGVRQSRVFETAAEVPDGALGRTLVLQAEVDAGREVREADEGNNLSEPARFPLPAPQRFADLVILGAPAVEHDPRRRRVTVRATVANVGSAPAGPHLLALVERSGALDFAPVAIDALGVRQSRVLETAAEVPEGLLGRTLVLQAEIDPEGEVREADEGNNLSQDARFALPAPERFADLLVTAAPDVGYEPRRRRVTVVVSVANAGAAPAGPHRLAVVDRSDTLRFPPVAVDGLDARARRDFETVAEVPDAALGRTLVLEAEIDAEGEVREADEGNNLSAPRRFTLPQAEPERFVDLVLAAAPEVDYDARRRRVAVRIAAANLGTGPAGPHRLAVVDRSGTLRFAPVRVDALDAGGRRGFEVVADVPEDALGKTLRLQAEIDAGREIGEREEGNNLSPVLRYTLPAPEPRGLADLAITAMRVGRHADGRSGEVAVSVSNRGSAASAATELELRADAHGAWKRVAVPGLAAGGTWSASWSFPLRGSFLAARLDVQALVDPDDVVAESLETNNRRRQAVELPVAPAVWIALAGIAAVAAAIGLGLRLRRPRPRPTARDAQAVAVRISYAAQVDPGSQTVEVHDDAAPVLFELSLRPAVDPGIQSITLEASR